MTQRIFDIENEKDMADLWDILPDEIEKIKKAKNSYELDILYVKDGGLYSSLFLIDWHDKTEITKPIQEATEADIGRLCCFWDYNDKEYFYFGILNKIENNGKEKSYFYRGGVFSHCRRLTKQEIEELC